MQKISFYLAEKVCNHNAKIYVAQNIELDWIAIKIEKDYE